MSSLIIDLPESLADKLKKLSEKDNIAPEKFIVITIAEKLDYLEERAKRANLEDFENILAKIPDVEPEEFDKI